VWERLSTLGSPGLNHVLVGALMFVFGVAVTLGTATAVQQWHLSRRPPPEEGPVIDTALLRPAFEYRRHSKDCALPMWPQPVNASSSLRQY
jgi:hypothetical protein